MGLDISDPKMVERSWGTTECFLGGSRGVGPGESIDVDRPYLRLDRSSLRHRLCSNVLGNGGNDRIRVFGSDLASSCVGLNVFAPPGSVSFGEGTTTVRLGDGTDVEGRIVVDGTGHESRMQVKGGGGGSFPGGPGSGRGLGGG